MLDTRDGLLQSHDRLCRNSPALVGNTGYEISCPTNLLSFVSFGKTQKLHNAIDHWLAGVTGHAHVALDTVTKEERGVYTDVTGRRRCKGGGFQGEGGGKRGGALGCLGKMVLRLCWASSERTSIEGDRGRLVFGTFKTTDVIAAKQAEGLVCILIETNLSSSSPHASSFHSCLSIPARPPLHGCKVCCNHCSSSSFNL